MKKVLSSVLLLVAAQLGLFGLWQMGVFSDPNSRVLGDSTNAGLDSRVTSLESRVYKLELATGLAKSTTTATAAKTYYVALNGGSNEAYDWTELPGTSFTFDQSLYGSSSNVTVTWEGWMDNGFGYVRLYDDTNHRAVDGSEIMVLSGVKSSFYSKTLSIWRGQNTYHIETKSLSGQVSLSSPRLKVVVK